VADFSGTYSDLFAKMMKPTEKEFLRNEGPNESTVKKLADAVAKVSSAKNDNSGDQKDKDQSWVKRLVDFARGQNKGNKRNPGTSSKGDSHTLNRIAKATEELYRASQTQHTLWVGICHINGLAQKQIAHAISMSDCCRAAAAAASRGAKASATSNAVGAAAAAAAGRGRGGRGRTPGAPGMTGGGAPDPNAVAGFVGQVASAGKTLLGIFALISKKLASDFGVSPLDQIFGGAIKDSNTFRENLRMLLHQQQGFVSENRELEATYKNITDSVNASGISRGQFQELWLKNLQRGLMLEGKGDKARNLAAQRVKSVLTTAANTAQFLGMNAESTNEMFMDWHYHLGLSALEVADIGRSMVQVARTTGVTGKELEKAMVSADKIMKSLKSSGSLTASASKNVITMSAAMQKFGVAEKGNELMTALSSREDFFAANDKIKSMLGRVAQNSGDPNMLNSVMTGSVLQSKSKIKGLGTGVENEMKSILENFSGDFKRMGVEMPKDMAQLTETMEKLRKTGPEGERIAANINTATKNRMGGSGVGDVDQIIKAFREMGKTSGDMIGEMRKKMEEMQKKGMTNLDEYRQLQRKMLEAQTDQSMTGFMELQKELKMAGVKSYEELSTTAKERLKKTLGEDMGKQSAQDFLKNMSGSAQEMMQSLSDRAQKAGINFNDLLDKRGIKNMDDAAKKIQEGGEAGELAMLALDEAMKELQQKERTSEDPVASIKEDVRKINNYLGEKLDKVLFSMSKDIANLLVWGGEVLTVLFAIGGAMALFGVALSPILGIAAVIVAIVLLVRELFKSFEGGAEFFQKYVLDPLLAVGRVIWDVLSRVFKIVMAVASVVWEVIAGVVKIIAQVLGGIMEVAVWLWDILSPIFDAIGEFLGGAIEAIKWVFNKLIGGIGSILSVIGGAVKILGSIVGGVLKVALWPFIQLFKLFGGILSSVGSVVDYFVELIGNFGSAIWDVIVFLVELPMTVIKAVAKLGVEVVKAIGSWLVEIPGLILDLLGGVGQLLWDSLSGVWDLIGGLGTWLWDNIIGGIGNLGVWMWDNIIGGIGDIGVWLWDTIVGGISGIGNWLWDILIGALQGIGDFLMSLIPGAAKAVEGYNADSSEERAKYRDEHDDSFSYGLGNTAGGIVDLDIPRVVGGLAEMGGSVVNGVVDAGGAVLEGVGDVLDWLNPFAVGTSEVERGGMGILHKGEAIIPSDVWKAMQGIVAEGKGFMSSGGGEWFRDFKNVFGGEASQTEASGGTDWLGSLSQAVGLAKDKVGASVQNLGAFSGGISGEASTQNFANKLGLSGVGQGVPVHDPALAEILENVFGPKGKGQAGAGAEGAFSPEAIGEAMGSAATTLTNRTYEDGGFFDQIWEQMKGSGEKAFAGMSNSGLFDGGSVGDALSGSVTELVTRWVNGSESSDLMSSLSNRVTDAGRSIFVELSRALDYETSASDSASGLAGAGLAAYGEVNPNSADYREEMSGDVSTLSATRSIVQQTLEQQRAGETSSASILVPSMDSIGEYLINTQADKLERMITLLSSIDDKMGYRSSSDIIGAISAGGPAIQRPGVKSIARDTTRGFWDLTFGDNSPGNVTTEGRGGSA
jgi:hypothetical protein